MAPLNQPHRLSDVSTKRVASIAEAACLGIAKSHGNYRRRPCRTAIRGLREHILANIGHAFDDVCRLISRFPPRIATPALKDPRILVDFMIHENTRTVPKLWNIHGLSSRKMAVFWEGQLCMLRNTSVLDVSKLRCTDAIMKTICDNGRHLEKFFFSSRSKNFSEVGLLFVTKCPELVVLDDGNYFIKFGHDIIRILLNSFPKIVSLNYLHMGALLAEGVGKTTLGLTVLDEKHAHADHIQAIARVCPDAQRLVLGRDENYTGKGDTLHTLTESDLKVDTLHLIDFPFKEILPLLRVKGVYLNILGVTHAHGIKGDSEIILIGQNCPHLKEFSFTILESAEERYDDRVVVTKTEAREMFYKLEILRIEGVILYESGIIQLCLQNAKHIHDVSLKISIEHIATFHDMMIEFLAKNVLKELTHLLIAGEKIKMYSKLVVEMFFTKLVSLQILHIQALMNKEVVDYFRSIDETIKEKNINLILFWENLGDGETGNVHVANDDEDDTVSVEDADEDKDGGSDSEEKEDND